MLSLNVSVLVLALLWILLLASLSVKREKVHTTEILDEKDEPLIDENAVSERHKPVNFGEWYELLENEHDKHTKIIFNPLWQRDFNEYTKFSDFCKDKGVSVIKEYNLDFQDRQSVIYFDDSILMPLLWNKGYNIKFVKGKSFTDLLKEVAPFTLILLSVKDDGSQALNHKWQEKLADYGVRKLTREFLHSSYINVIWKKGAKEYISLFEEVSDKAITKTISSGYKVKDFNMPIHLEVKSAGYNSGNVSSVKINGEEFSPNLRGMNIIMYDLIESKVRSVHRVDTFVSIFEDNTIYCAYPEEERK
ncbi:hypothetical protein GCM10008014_55740 [Paenibacillus silvae]|uniref:Uncharacterized protein n=1 Tax=Paenibacillus silvae TaxID=1325358 RepID=A0ABQ1ZPP2_9BACL|nr:hypothetical protein GCM10008014_55740 [Paenibacillus silvae]